MERIIRILFWMIFFVLLYIGVSSMAKCKSATKEVDDTLENVQSNVSEVGDNIEELADGLFEDSDDDAQFEDGEDIDVVNQIKDVEDDRSNEIEDVVDTDDELVYVNEESDEVADALFQEAPEVEKPVAVKTKTQTTPQRRTQSSNLTGKYLIVAGNYRIEENAQEMIVKLGDLGFTKAEYLRFDESQYYTVVATRTNNNSEAQSLTNSLKNQGISCYVHTQRD